jgi:hypothetical protein
MTKFFDPLEETSVLIHEISAGSAAEMESGLHSSASSCQAPLSDLLPEKEKVSAHFDNRVVVVAITALRLFAKTSRSSVRIGKVLSGQMVLPLLLGGPG